MKYNVYNPYKLNTCLPFVNKIINDNWISFKGKYVNLCETKLEELLNIKHVLLTNNGTSSTHCLIKSIKYKYPNCKKIYLPDNCFIAVYNVTLLEFDENQIEIIPTDPETFNIDLNFIKYCEKNSAIVIVHNIGNIIPINKIRPDIILVEDNCEGFMGKYGDDFSGTKTLCSSISFFPNKHITCGEGGAFCTNDTKLYDYIKSYSRQGITDIRYKYDSLGHNYRISNINACLLYSQILLINEILQKKKQIYNWYEQYLKDTPIKFQKKEINTTHSYWMVCIKFNNKFNYHEIEDFFNKNNIEIRQFFFHYKIHNHLKNIKMINNIDNQLENYCIILPSYPDLLEKDIIYICNVVNNYTCSFKSLS